MEKLKFLMFILITANLSSPTRLQSCTEFQVKIVCSMIFNESYSVIGFVRQCKAIDVISKNPHASLTEVVNKNDMKFTNTEKIEGLEISGVSLMFLPSGIKTKFPKLRVLFINPNGGLLCVSKENLKELGSSLEFFGVVNNRITFIEADLFEHNPNIKLIHFYNNPIRYIDPDFFMNLMKLEKVEWITVKSSTDCIDQDFRTSREHNLTAFKWNSKGCLDVTAKDDVQKFANKQEMCFDSTTPLATTESFDSNDDIIALVQKLSADNEELKKKVESLTRLVIKNSENVEAVTQTMNQLNSAINYLM